MATRSRTSTGKPCCLPPTTTTVTATISSYLGGSICRFSTTRSLPARSIVSFLEHRHAGIPPYPYGIAQQYKQSNRGLYGGARLRAGNNVGERNAIKTKRRWRVNVQRKRLHSPWLGRHVRVRLSTRVLRTIDREGGLDAYLTKATGGQGRIRDLGMEGWLLRWRVMQTPGYQAWREQERRRLGLVKGVPAEWERSRSGQKGDTEWIKSEIARFDALLAQEGADAIALGIEAQSTGDDGREGERPSRDAREGGEMATTDGSVVDVMAEAVQNMTLDHPDDAAVGSAAAKVT